MNIFLHVDSILATVHDLNFAVLLAPLYLGCCHDGWIEILEKEPNTVEKCREVRQMDSQTPLITSKHNLDKWRRLK